MHTPMPTCFKPPTCTAFLPHAWPTIPFTTSPRPFSLFPYYPSLITRPIWKHNPITSHLHLHGQIGFPPCLLCHEKRAIKQPTRIPLALLPGTWRSMGGGVTFLRERKDQRAYKTGKNELHRRKKETWRNPTGRPRNWSHSRVRPAPTCIRPTLFSIRLQPLHP